MVDAKARILGAVNDILDVYFTTKRPSGGRTMRCHTNQHRLWHLNSSLMTGVRVVTQLVSYIACQNPQSPCNNARWRLQVADLHSQRRSLL